MERFGLWLIYLAFAAYVVTAIYFSIAEFPWGLILLAFAIGAGLLFAKAWRDRISNPEDEHYAQNVQQ